MKIKPLTKEQIIISADRLTRFKNPETKYLRVFSDILLHNLIAPRFSRNDLDNMDYESIKNLAQEVINNSLSMSGYECKNDYVINKALLDYETSVFVTDSNILKLIDNKINYRAILNLLSDDIPKNLQWLKALGTAGDIRQARKDLGFKFPIDVLVLAEGATEETLLPEFGKLCGFDFDKEGVFLYASGGKNQVVKSYYEFADSLKIPIFVLFDRDGKENADEIMPKLRTKDKIHILKCGEFEDILSEKHFQRALDYELKNISIPATEIDSGLSRVKILEEIFKKRGMHELKKAEFAKTVKFNIQSSEDLTPELAEIIGEIKNLAGNF